MVNSAGRVSFQQDDGVPLFYRLTTDRRVIPAAWENACAGPTPAACWLIGGGPSLASLPCDDIARSPAPKFAVNLAGTKLIRPNFWTAYDPSIRFHKSLYLDAGVTKFLPRSRSMNLVPETTFKVCECPQTCFFDRDPQRGYHDLLKPQALGITDWGDSLVQAIEIAYRLGFRRLFLAGCECCVRPCAEWISRAEERGIRYVDGELLMEYAGRCRGAGLDDETMAQLGTGPLYHFDEVKTFAATLQTDAHYYRIVQALRLSRQSMSTAGLQLISVTPGSRLNSFFDEQPVDAVLDDMRLQIGDPRREPTRGLYTQTADRRRLPDGLMRDVPVPRRPAPIKPGSELKNAEMEPGRSPELIVEEERWEAVGEA